MNSETNAPVVTQNNVVSEKWVLVVSWTFTRVLTKLWTAQTEQLDASQKTLAKSYATEDNNYDWRNDWKLIKKTKNKCRCWLFKNSKLFSMTQNTVVIQCLVICFPGLLELKRFWKKLTQWILYGVIVATFTVLGFLVFTYSNCLMIWVWICVIIVTGRFVLYGDPNGDNIWLGHLMIWAQVFHFDQYGWNMFILPTINDIFALFKEK